MSGRACGPILCPFQDCGALRTPAHMTQAQSTATDRHTRAQTGTLAIQPAHSAAGDRDGGRRCSRIATASSYASEAAS